jgi:hypothetical protein
MTGRRGADSAFSRPVVLPTADGTVADAGHNTPFCTVRPSRAVARDAVRGADRPFTRRL